jgi:hypothetical protein
MNIVAYFKRAFMYPALPGFFCWTRIGPEAAEPIQGILRRKEQERVANGGVFLWGIGNAVGPSLSELLDPHAPNKSHYALVCRTNVPLGSTVERDQIPIQALTNILSGRRIGASQVTAVVQHSGERADGTRYVVTMRANLVYPYMIRLRDPSVIPGDNVGRHNHCMPLPIFDSEIFDRRPVQ